MTTKTRNEAFWEWAEKQREERSLSWNAVEKLGGAGNAAISKRAKDQLPPTKLTIDVISEVLKIPPERVFREAGWLPPRVIGGRYYKQKGELLDYFEALDPSNRRAVLGLAQTLYEQRERNEEEH